MRARLLPHLALLITAAPPAAAQYLELGPGVRLSPAMLDSVLVANERAARELGLITLDQFLGSPPPRAAAARAVTGTLSAIVIPALFADSPADPPVTAEELRRVLFDGPVSPGTVTEYFAEASRGQLTITGGVADWVRTTVTLADAAGTLEGHGWIGPLLWRHVREALALADQAVDFGQYDNNGPDGVPNSPDDDGVVDAVIILEPAITGSCGGPGIWPHFGGVSNGQRAEPYLTNERTPAGDPLRIPVYVLAGAMDCTGTEPDGPAVVAHELGHRLGLPDYYVPITGITHDQRHWLVGCWDLMAAGAWGCGTGIHASGFGPARLSPYSRQRLGWLTFEDVPLGTEGTYTLAESADAATALRIPLASGRDEYLLVEYRPASGFDAGLPAGGVVVYHLDLSYRRGTGAATDSVPIYGYYVVEADGDDALRRLEVQGGNRGAAGDVFGLGVSALTDSTTPTVLDHGLNPSGVALTSIEVDAAGGVARLHVTNGPAFGVVPLDVTSDAVAAEPYESRVRVWSGTGAITAAVAGGFPDGVTVRVAADTVIAAGIPLQVGSFTLRFDVRDAGGEERRVALPLVVRDAEVDHGAIAATLVAPGAPALIPVIQAYLDRSGNSNGRLDAGDFRAYLQRTGGLPPQ